MKTLKPRERFIFIICVALIFVFACYQFLAKPFLEQAEMIDQKIDLQESKLKKNLETIEQGQSIDAEFNSLLQVLGEKPGDEAELVSAIESAATQTNVNISNMQPQKVVSKDSYKLFAVNLVMDGKWKDMMQFLYLLENAPHFCQVQQITIKKNSMMADTVRGRLTIGKLRVVR